MPLGSVCRVYAFYVVLTRRRVDGRAAQDDDATPETSRSGWGRKEDVVRIIDVVCFSRKYDRVPGSAVGEDPAAPCDDQCRIVTRSSWRLALDDRTRLDRQRFTVFHEDQAG